MQLRLLNVAVDGGDMRVLLWGTGKRVAVAVHGITGSGMSWQAVARHMPPDWTLAAPDLRGRGHSRDLPGPYGLERHARDVVAVLRHFGGRPVLAGHSMGAYIALLARDSHPRLVRRLVLVDGGPPLAGPGGAGRDVRRAAAADRAGGRRRLDRARAGAAAAGGAGNEPLHDHVRQGGRGRRVPGDQVGCALTAGVTQAAGARTGSFGMLVEVVASGGALVLSGAGLST